MEHHLFTELKDRTRVLWDASKMQFCGIDHDLFLFEIKTFLAVMPTAIFSSGLRHLFSKTRSVAK